MSEFRSIDSTSPSARPARRWGLAVAALLLATGAAVAWRLGSTRAGFDAAELARWIEPLRASPLAVPVTLVGYVIAGLLLVPMSFVMVATGLSFGPFEGAALALGGCMLSASVSFAIGNTLGRDWVQRFSSPRMQRLNDILRQHGFWAIATVRVVPVAPFGLVNLVAGASEITFRDYFLGTLATLTPTVVLSSLFGDRLGALLRDPSTEAIAGSIALLLILAGTGVWMRRRVLAHRGGEPIVRPREPY